MKNENPTEEDIKKRRKIITIEIIVISIIVSCGFFPIINFNPENPVEMGPLRILLIFVAIIFFAEAGSLESMVFPGFSTANIAVVNIINIVLGLIFRFMIEFGEASNSYNFTLVNILFHVTLLTLVSTLVCFIDKKRHSK